MRQTRFGPWLAALATALATGVRGDVIEMIDGRHFEGEIVAENDSAVSIDTKVSSTIRTTLRLPWPQIKSVTRGPVAETFFDQPPPPARVSDPAAQGAGDTLYLEVPINGALGQEVFAEGIDRVLRYAKRYRIEHIVFVIDSEGGDLEEAAAAYNLLRSDRHQLTYHAIIRNATDAGLAIPVWCDSIHILPGARLGGTQGALSSAEDDAADEVLRAQIANDIVRNVDLEGAEGSIVRAMIDPRVSLAAWVDDDGEVVVGEKAPPDAPPDRIIFSVGPGQLLLLDEPQAVRLGADAFRGSAASLGEALGHEGWTLESDIGRSTMDEVRKRKQREAADATASYNARVEDNIRKRRTAEGYLEECLQHAAEWDPGSESYEYYVRRWGWGMRRGKIRMTQQSRQRWQQRSDTVIGYLQEAAKAVTALEKLDREATELGLEPTFSPQDLRWVRQDIQTKYNDTVTNRNRRS